MYSRSGHVGIKIELLKEKTPRKLKLKEQDCGS